MTPTQEGDAYSSSWLNSLPNPAVAPAVFGGVGSPAPEAMQTKPLIDGQPLVNKPLVEGQPDVQAMPMPKPPLKRPLNQFEQDMADYMAAYQAGNAPAAVPVASIPATAAPAAAVAPVVADHPEVAPEPRQPIAPVAAAAPVAPVAAVAPVTSADSYTPPSNLDRAMTFGQGRK